MKAYRNILIVGEKTNFVSMTFENMDTPVKVCVYPNLMSEGKNNTNTVNSLSIINRYLAEIYKNRNDNERNVHYFVIPNNISKSIKSGTYKNWIKTGRTNTGYVLDKDELYQWTIFASLYKELFNEIDFKPLSYYGMKSFKYNVKQMMFTKELINKAYQIMEERKTNSLQSSLEDLLR